MSTTVAGDPLNFPASITIPSDGDGPSIKAADVNVGFEALADRTAYLAAQDDALLDEGFPEGWPLLKSGNSKRTTTEYQPFFYWEQLGAADGDFGIWAGDNDSSTLGSIFAGGTTADVAANLVYIPISSQRHPGRDAHHASRGL